MRRSRPDPGWADRLSGLAAGLQRCQQCGACTSVCPSGRHGGLDCAGLMAKAALGAVDPATESKMWSCAGCMSCSERCPSSAGPAELIVLLREVASSLGNRPCHIDDEAKLYHRTGLCFPCTGLTKKMRRDLGLEEADLPEDTVREVRDIVSRTRLRGVLNE